MKRAIVTTTIYVPRNLMHWARLLRQGDIIVVAGDQRTPHGLVRQLLDNITLDTGVETRYVLETDTRTSRAVPWNSIQRRNVATLEAMHAGATLITTVDTDNYPLAYNHMGKIQNIMSSLYDGPLIHSTTGWANVGHIVTPRVTHRGFPLHVTSDWHSVETLDECRIGVHASLWLGDPDISALERLLYNPTIIDVPSMIVLDRDTWCPFNSQATTFQTELLPLLNVWPGVGRMDDIWSSYVARRIIDHLGWHVAYGAPNVSQERHAHDVVTDLEREIIGYRHTGTLIDIVKSIDLTGIDNALDALETSFKALTTSLMCDIVQESTRDSWVAWIADMRELKGD